MGYRSSWYLAIEGDTANKVRQIIKDKSFPEDLQEFMDSVEHEEFSDESAYFEMCDVKMYESYPEVAAFYKFLDSLDQDDFRYYEIGEEEGDISSQGLNIDLIYTRTEVVRY